MRTIWKFPIQVTDLQSVTMPDGAKILTAAVQRGQPCLWAEVDPSAPMCERSIAIFGTGHELPDDPGSYIGTFQVDHGVFVFHVYEK